MLTSSQGGLLLDTLDEYAKELALENLRKTSRIFAAFDDIVIILDYMVRNSIAPDSVEWKHSAIDLSNASQKFNEAFIAHGINPNLQIHCEKI